MNIVHGRDFAQIDHLIVYKYGFIVIESKSITGEVSINEYGEWSRSYKGNWKGIPSPIKQAEEQMNLLKGLLGDNAERLLIKIIGVLQARFGGRQWHSIVAVSSNAIIHRDAAPKDVVDKMLKTEFLVEKLDQIMKLKKSLFEKVTLSDERPAFTAEEMSKICRFLIAVDKKVTDFKAKMKNEQKATAVIEAKSQPQNLKATATDSVRDTPEVSNKEEVKAALRCKSCGQSNSLAGRYGKYGYYVQCGHCQTNTSMKADCPSCSSRDTKVRKEGACYFINCLSCNAEALIHKDIA